MFRRVFSLVLTGILLFTRTITPGIASAQGAGMGVSLPQAVEFFTPVLVKGLTVYPEDPFRFDFIVNPGDTAMRGDALKVESTTLIKYFLAALTTPENEMWVNLSPYEKDRIIPEAFGQTRMGEDLLSLDHRLKQMSSAFTDPRQALGKDFWDRVHARAQAEFGTQDIPLEMFNKIWIVPQDVLILERGNSAFVVRSRMKVMLDSDYVLTQQSVVAEGGNASLELAKEVMREIILPSIEREVNEGRSFANLRQIYHAMILAVWYKKNLKNTLLSRVYVDQHKISGVNIEDKDAAQKTYAEYVEAFKRGAYNFIQEEHDPLSWENVPRQYFSGGIPGVTEKDVAVTQDISVLTLREQKDLNGVGDVTVEVKTLPVEKRLEDAPFIQAKSDDAEHSPAQKRVKEIDGLLSKIKKEREIAGSGDLPKFFVMSDFHGEVKLFLKYVADAISRDIGKTVVLDENLLPGETIRDQLAGQLTAEQFKAVKIKFMLLGDLIDRGPSGMKVFWIVKQLVDLGWAKYVTGNHDLWASLNLAGFHLPVNENYKFYGTEEAVRQLKALVKAHADDEDIAKDRVAWWTARLAEYNASQAELQKRFEKVHERMKKLYMFKENDLSDSEKVLAGVLVGRLLGGDVATGFNAVGMMSVGWWKARLAEVDTALAAAEARGDRQAYLVWGLFRQNAETVLQNVEKHYTQALDRGAWWWQVFDAINGENYTSVEWWAEHWSVHEGWGPSIIDELNALEGKKNWDQSNYIASPYLKEMAQFFRRNFTLFIEDAYGNHYTHGWLPVNEETGEVSFDYKGVTYAGENVWKGLLIIQNEVRDMTTPISELQEAFSLVNAFYADKTTRIKPSDIRNYVTKLGLKKIYTGLGIRTWFTGHNPLNKLVLGGVDSMLQEEGYVHVSVDKGLSWEKYNDLGAYSHISAEGIHSRGYTTTDFKKIADDPDTFVFRKKGDVRYVERSWPNKPLERDAFLNLMETQLKEELARLDAPVQVGETFQQGGINLDPARLTMEITRDAQGAPLAPEEQPVFNMNLTGLIPVIMAVIPHTPATESR